MIDKIMEELDHYRTNIDCNECYTLDAKQYIKQSLLKVQEQTKKQVGEEIKEKYNEVFEAFIPADKFDEANNMLIDLVKEGNKMGRDLLKE